MRKRRGEWKMFSDRITSDDCILQPRFPLFLHEPPGDILGGGLFGVNFLLGGGVPGLSSLALLGLKTGG